MPEHPLSKGRVDTTLSSDSVTSRREQFGNTGSVETSFRKTECRTQTGTTSANHDGVVLVVLRTSSQNPDIITSHSIPSVQLIRLQ